MSVPASTSKTLVNNIPLATIYAGMNVERFHKLRDLYADAVITTITTDDDDTMTEQEFDNLVADRFYNACQRKSKKAGWYARVNNIKRKAKVNK